MSSYQLAANGISTLSNIKTYSNSVVRLPTKKESISFAGGQVEKVCLATSEVGSM